MKKAISWLLCFALLLCAGALPAAAAQEAAEVTPILHTIGLEVQDFSVALQPAVLQKTADTYAGPRAVRSATLWHHDTNKARSSAVCAQQSFAVACSSTPKGDVLARFTQMSQPLYGDAFGLLAIRISAIWAA